MRKIIKSAPDCKGAKELVDCVLKMIDIDTIDEKSKVYDTVAKDNVYLHSLRSSKKVQLLGQDPKAAPLFKSMQSFIDKTVNAQSHGLAFDLIPNDIDIIRYDAGDFFGRHADFVPIKSSFVEYYSLLICVDVSNDLQGGETVLYLPSEPDDVCKNTVTLSGWLLFPNTVEHESLLVKQGRKIVMKANVVTFGSSLAHPTMRLLVDTRSDIVKSFLASSGNVLPMSSLSDYLFYRKYFDGDETVVPFQFLAGSNCQSARPSNEEISKIHYFSIYNSIPVVDFAINGEAFYDRYDEEEQKDNHDDLRNDRGSRRVAVKANKNFERFKTTVLPTQNEIVNAFSMMQYYFWTAALQFSGNDNEFRPYGQMERIAIGDIASAVEKKVTHNMQMMQKVEIEAFALPPLSVSERIFAARQEKKARFDTETIEAIVSKFGKSSMSYYAGGLHYCNETYYDEFSADIYFGFFRL